MSYHVVVDARDLPRFNPSHRDPLWWGVAGLIAIESTVVLSYLVTYFYLRMGSGQWPPAGLGAPDLLLPSIDTGLLLVSAACMWLASRAMSRVRRTPFLVYTALALLLDTAVLVLRWLQLQQFPFRWSDHAYGSIVWVMTGLHFAHVASAIAGTSVIFVLGWMDYWTKERQLGVVIDTFYWYFVSLIWVPMYLTIYWAPRVLG